MHLIPDISDEHIFHILTRVNIVKMHVYSFDQTINVAQVLKYH